MTSCGSVNGTRLECESCARHERSYPLVSTSCSNGLLRFISVDNFWEGSNSHKYRPLEAQSSPPRGLNKAHSPPKRIDAYAARYHSKKYCRGRALMHQNFENHHAKSQWKRGAIRLWRRTRKNEGFEKKHPVLSQIRVPTLAWADPANGGGADAKDREWADLKPAQFVNYEAGRIAISRKLPSSFSIVPTFVAAPVSRSTV